MRAHTKTAPLSRFEKKYTPEIASGCWLWTANTLRTGYGQFHITQDIAVLAHRFSYAAYVAPIPEGLHVLHTCDVRACVNPAHLRLGTHADNMKDRNDKGRQARGEKMSRVQKGLHAGEHNGRAKLTRAAIEAIRKDTRVLRLVAADYSMSLSQISAIRAGKSWRKDFTLPSGPPSAVSTVTTTATTVQPPTTPPAATPTPEGE